MTQMFSTLLSKLYWPVVGFFVLALLVYGISFFITIERAADGGFYNTRTLKTMAACVAILVGSVYLKQHGNTQAAHLILFVPFGLMVLAVLLFFAMAFMMG